MRRQVTGGLYRHWQNLNLAEVGYPIAEINDDGSCVITKPDGSGGVVNRHTVAEQLVYEIGDPARYLTPDVIVDFTIRRSRTTRPRPCASARRDRPRANRYIQSIAGLRCRFCRQRSTVSLRQRLRRESPRCGEMILRRVERTGFTLEHTLIECLGAGDAATRGIPPSTWTSPAAAGRPPSLEVVLRVSVHDSRREAVERFTKEFAPLITTGPPGLAGYATGRPQVRLVYAYWPTLIPKQLAPTRTMSWPPVNGNMWNCHNARIRKHPTNRELPWQRYNLATLPTPAAAIKATMPTSGSWPTPRLDLNS